MPTIDEIVDTLGAADLEAEARPEPEPPVPPMDLPLKAVKWIAKRIADPRKFSDHDIAAAANAKLAQMGITANHANPVKPRAHVAKIRRARLRRLAALQE